MNQYRNGKTQCDGVRFFQGISKWKFRKISFLQLILLFTHYRSMTFLRWLINLKHFLFDIFGHFRSVHTISFLLWFGEDDNVTALFGANSQHLPILPRLLFLCAYLNIKYYAKRFQYLCILQIKKLADFLLVWEFVFFRLIKMHSKCVSVMNESNINCQRHSSYGR